MTDIEEMRAQVAAHDEQVETECRAALAKMVGSKAYGTIRAEIAGIAERSPRSPISDTIEALTRAFDLAERLAR